MPGEETARLDDVEEKVGKAADVLGDAYSESHKRAAEARDKNLLTRGWNLMIRTGVAAKEYAEGVRGYSKQLERIANDFSKHVDDAMKGVKTQMSNPKQMLIHYRHIVSLRAPRNILNEPVSSVTRGDVPIEKGGGAMGVRQMLGVQAEDLMQTEGYRKLQQVIAQFNEVAVRQYKKSKRGPGPIQIQPDIDVSRRKLGGKKGDFDLELDFFFLDMPAEEE